MSEFTSIKEFGYNFLGPLLHTYFAAVGKLVSTKRFHTYHLAREGYHLKSAFESLFGSSNSTYLYVSRTFLFRIMITDEYSWRHSLKHGFEGPLRNFLISRFGFNSVEADKLLENIDGSKHIVLPDQMDEVATFLRERLDSLAALVAHSKQAYMIYLDEIGLLKSELTPLFLDLGYSGTIQQLLTRLIQRNTEGCYFITTKDGDHQVDDCVATMHFVFNTQVKMGSGYTLLDRSMFLESLLTAPQGQFTDIRYIAGSRQLFFGKRSFTQNHPKKLETVFDGALEAIHDFNRDAVSFSISETEDLFKVFVTKRNTLPSATWGLFEFDDAISGFGTVNSLQFFGL